MVVMNSADALEMIVVVWRYLDMPSGQVWYLQQTGFHVVSSILDAILVQAHRDSFKTKSTDDTKILIRNESFQTHE